MRIRNISKVPVVAAGLAIPPGRIGYIDEAEWKEWMARSTGNALMASTKLRVESDAEAEAVAPADADDSGGGAGADDSKTAEEPAGDAPKPKPKSKR